MTIASDVQSLSPGSIITLYELDTTSLGGALYRFHPGLNELKNEVVWGGNTYTAFPIEASGFEMTTQGTLPRPTIKVANVTGLVSTLAKTYNDLTGAKLTRKRTLLKYLDAVNFAGGNPSADSTQSFPNEIYYVNRKISENRVFLEFELVSSIDLHGVKLPRRQVIQNVCTWKYRGIQNGDATGCPYTGTNYFDTTDSVVLSSTEDVCGKRLSSCKARFGEYATLPFGGFPSVGLF